jgi:hypothetical protein
VVIGRANPQGKRRTDSFVSTSYKISERVLISFDSAYDSVRDSYRGTRDPFQDHIFTGKCASPFRWRVVSIYSHMKNPINLPIVVGIRFPRWALFGGKPFL